MPHAAGGRASFAASPCAVAALGPIVPLMSETRLRILDAAATLIAERGYHRMSVDDVIGLASISGKSHFYHYFRSKEQLGLEVLERGLERFAEQGAGVLGDRSREPMDRLRHFMDALVMLHSGDRVADDDALGNLCTEIFVLPEGFRARLALAFARWASQIEKLLGEASASLAPGTDTRRLSQLIVATLEGALMLSKVNRDARVLREVGTELKRIVSMHVREGVTA